MSDAVWLVEIHDPTWGGWKAITKGFDNDDPAEFPSKAAADRTRRGLAYRSVYQYRTREVSR